LQDRKNTKAKDSLAETMALVQQSTMQRGQSVRYATKRTAVAPSPTLVVSPSLRLAVEATPLDKALLAYILLYLEILDPRSTTIVDTSGPIALAVACRYKATCPTTILTPQLNMWQGMVEQYASHWMEGTYTLPPVVGPDQPPKTWLLDLVVNRRRFLPVRVTTEYGQELWDKRKKKQEEKQVEGTRKQDNINEETKNESPKQKENDTKRKPPRTIFRRIIVVASANNKEELVQRFAQLARLEARLLSDHKRPTTAVEMLLAYPHEAELVAQAQRLLFVAQFRGRVVVGDTIPTCVVHTSRKQRIPNNSMCIYQVSKRPYAFVI